MDEVNALAEAIVHRIAQQQQFLSNALHWPLPDLEEHQQRLPTPLHADLSLFVAIARGEVERSTADSQMIGDVIERLQHLLDLLFKPVSGYYGYSIPPNFWTTTPLGQVLARVQAWLRADDLISFSEAAELLFPEIASTNLQAARMRVKRLVERGLLQSYRDPREPNPTHQRRVSRLAADALKASGQSVQLQRVALPGGLPHE